MGCMASLLSSSSTGLGWGGAREPHSPGAHEDAVHIPAIVTQNNQCCQLSGAAFVFRAPRLCHIKASQLLTGIPTARRGCRRGWCPCPPAGCVAIIFLSLAAGRERFEGGAAAVFGFVVQALDLLLPGPGVFVC